MNGSRDICICTEARGRTYKLILPQGQKLLLMNNSRRNAYFLGIMFGHSGPCEEFLLNCHQEDIYFNMLKVFLVAKFKR